MHARRWTALNPVLRSTVMVIGMLCFPATLPVVGQVPRGATTSSLVAEKPSATAKLPVYDVVTIRPNDEGSGGVDVDVDVNTYSATNITLLNLIHRAYDVQINLISGGPKWVESKRFDVRAKVVDADPEELKNQPSADQRRMLQTLLVERFHLQLHSEVKTLPVFELVQAKGGAKLTQVDAKNKDDGYQGMSPGSTSVNNGNLTAAYRTMTNLADTLSSQVHRTVLDKTGLPGHYNFQLSWTRDDAPASDAATAPPLLTSLEEQLGLKLVPSKGPVTTLVIDRADMPSEDGN